MRTTFVLYFLSLLSINGCVSVSESDKWTDGAVYKEGKRIKRQYVASEERRNQILAGYNKLHIGLSMEDVRKVMGPPDEASRDVVLRPLEDWSKYDKIGTYSGYTYTYSIKDIGTLGSCENQCITCKFSLDKTLVSTTVMGIDGLNNLNK